MKISIRYKFIVPTVILVMVGMGISATVSYMKSKTALEKVISEQVEGQTTSTSSALESWLHERKLNVQSWTQEKAFPLAVDDSWVDNSSRKKSSARLASFKADYQVYESLSLTDRTGLVVASSDPEHVGSVNVADAPYFKRAMAGEFSMGKVFKSPHTGRPVIAVSTPILLADEITGVLYALTDIQAFAKNFIDPVRVGENGFAYVLDESGMAVCYPDKDKIYRQDYSSMDVWKSFNESSSGTVEYEMDGMKRVEAFKRMEALGCSLHVAAMESEIFQPVENLGRFSLLTTIVLSLFSAVIIFFVAGGIVRPLNLVVNGLKDVVRGEGDLTKRIDVKSRDEVEALARWFNLFMEKIQKIVTDISINADELGVSSGDLAGISQEMTRQAESTSSQAGNLGNAGEEMSSHIGSVAEVIQQTTENAGMVAAAAEQIHVTIDGVAESTRKAGSITGKAVQQATLASERVGDLGIAAGEIEHVIETITDISEQVNLLALNATIEAARAGDAGKGFAVVAGEIKTLAGQTADASSEIKDKVEGIQSSAGNTVAEIEGITSVVRDIDAIVSNISTSVEEQALSTREIAANITQVSSGVVEINQSMSKASKVVSEITGDIGEVSRAAENMSEGSGRVSSRADELSGQAQSLKELVSQFKV